ncbi:MAG TPA: pantoate--beta-alanine ligase [Dehalococcoidia bacterium]
MRTVTSIQELREARRALPGPVGFVPTMGYLHQGHLALVRRARAENASVAVSIFVNPTQFGPTEDFERYPRDPERDAALLREAGVDLLFMPPPAEMYPPGYDTWVDVGGVTARLEGAERPGHFRGVATVVTKLFNLVQPDRAYFGQKDAQQLVVIQKLTRDLNLPVEIVPCPTVREPDGLAMSSRNVYLTPEERREALALSRALREAERLFAAGERDAGVLRDRVRAVIAEGAPRGRIDYVSVADAETLAELEWVDRRALVSLAVRFPSARLIDNTVLEP